MHRKWIVLVILISLVSCGPEAGQNDGRCLEGNTCAYEEMICGSDGRCHWCGGDYDICWRGIPVRKVLPAVQKANAYPVDGLTHRVVRGKFARKDRSACQIISAINVGGMNFPAAKGTHVKRDLPAERTNYAIDVVGRISHVVTAIDAWKVTASVDSKVSASNAAGMTLPAVRGIPAGKATFALRIIAANNVVMKTNPAVRVRHVIHGTSAAQKVSVPHVGDWTKQAARARRARDGSSFRTGYVSILLN